MLARSTADELFGGDAPDEYDIRVQSIGHTQHLDDRRYRLGLHHIDVHMKPMRAGKFIVIGAREGQGKTALAEKIALTNSEKYRVLFASLEMPREDLRDRMLAKLMRCTVDDVHRALAANDDDYYMAQALLDQRDLMIWRPRRGKRSIAAITNRAENVSADLLILDYTRLIDGWEPGTRAKDIVNELADWTTSTGISTALLAQLRDEAVGRRPHTGHLQDTTQLAQRADHIALLWRPFLGHSRNDHIAEVIIPKNRGGPCFRAHAHWTGSTTDFHAMTPEEEATALCCKRKRKDES